MYTRSWEQFPGWSITLYCMGPLAMQLLLELEAKKSVLQPDVRERCILLELSTRGQAMEKKHTLLEPGKRSTQEPRRELFSPQVSL